MAELMYKIANEEAADLRTARSWLTQNLADLVALAMSKRPETRYQDGDQFAADLRLVMAELSGNKPGSATGGAASPPAASPQAAIATSRHAKTAVMATASIAATATAGFDKTVVQKAVPSSAAPSETDFEKTLVHQSVPATDTPDTAFEKTVVHKIKDDDKAAPKSGGAAPDVEI